MGVREGYKQTEVGIIPEDWEVSALSEIGFPLIGLTYKPENVATEGTLVLRSSNVQNGRLSFEDNVFVTSEVSERIHVKKGDILICVRNGSRNLIGKCAVIDFTSDKVTFGAFMSIFRTEMYSFIFQSFQSDILKRQIDNNIGATINQITNKNMAEFVIPLPPLPEQKAIAAALSDTDELIAGLEALVAKKRAIKQGAMQQLLTGRKRLPGFTGEWEEKRLGDVASMSSGGTPSSSIALNYGGSIPWVSISDMTQGGKWLVDTERKLTLMGLNSSAAKIFKAPVLLYAMYASIGECCLCSFDVSTSQAILSITVLPSLSMEYLFYWMNGQKEEIKALGQQGTQSNLNKQIVQNFELVLPSYAEQQAIAAVLSDMDAEIESLEEQLGKTRALKQGMMQELLTGRIRLV